MNSDELFEQAAFTGYKPVCWDPLNSVKSYRRPVTPVPLQKRDEWSTQIHPEDKFRGMEVGDDRVDIAHNHAILENQLRIQEDILGMKTSKEDTFITTCIWNFTEVTGIIPYAKEQSFDHARKSSKGFENLGFIDVPRLRIILDTHKGNMNFSNSISGKASMLARDTNASRSEFSENIQLSSFLQDAILGTLKSPEPKYLPKIMGGSGAAAPFGNPLNIYSYIESYRGGTYSRVYGTATNELKLTLEENSMGKPAEPWLCKKLRDKQEYLHGTYDHIVFVPEDRGLTSQSSVPPEPIYRALGTSSGVSGVESRLMASKRLVTSKNAQIMMDQKARLDFVLDGFETVCSLELRKKISSGRARKKYDGALTANTAFQRLLNRDANHTDVQKLVGDPRFKVVQTGQMRFTISDATWLAGGGRYRNLKLSDIATSSDMFLFEDVAVENSLRISGVTLRPVHNLKGVVEQETKKKIGLYQINSSKEEWADKIISALKSERVGPEETVFPLTAKRILMEDPEWVNDDSLIISRILESGQSITQPVLIVTSDVKLCKQIFISTKCPVYRFDPQDLLKVIRRSEWSVDSVITVDELRAVWRSVKDTFTEDDTVYIDTGNLMHYLQEMEVVETKGKAVKLFSKKLLRGGYIPRRWAEYEYIEIPPHDLKIVPKRYGFQSSKPYNEYDLGRTSIPEGNWERGSDISTTTSTGYQHK